MLTKAWPWLMTDPSWLRVLFLVSGLDPAQVSFSPCNEPSGNRRARGWKEVVHSNNPKKKTNPKSKKDMNPYLGPWHFSPSQRLSHLPRLGWEVSPLGVYMI